MTLPPPLLHQDMWHTAGHTQGCVVHLIVEALTDFQELNSICRFDLLSAAMEKPREKRKSITKDLEGETELVAREGDREETGPSPKKKTKKKSPTSKSPRKATLHKSVDEDHHHATAEGRPPWFIFFGLFYSF
jgi:hypothetical protein